MEELRSKEQRPDLKKKNNAKKYRKQKKQLAEANEQMKNMLTTMTREEVLGHLLPCAGREQLGGFAARMQLKLKGQLQPGKVQKAAPKVPAVPQPSKGKAAAKKAAAKKVHKPGSGSLERKTLQRKQQKKEDKAYLKALKEVAEPEEAPPLPPPAVGPETLKVLVVGEGAGQVYFGKEAVVDKAAWQNQTAELFVNFQPGLQRLHRSFLQPSADLQKPLKLKPLTQVRRVDMQESSVWPEDHARRHGG